jgi:hypothetical protein
MFALSEPVLPFSPQHLHSQSSIVTGFAFPDPTNHRLKIFEKNTVLKMYRLFKKIVIP